jgi:Uma2 family endonuclease
MNLNLLQHPAAAGLEPRQRFVLHGIRWEGYEKLLDLLGEVVRMNYYRGTLEIMSPYPIHEVLKTLLGYLFAILTEDLAIPMKALASMTYRRPDVEGGIEPDLSFYLTGAARVRNWRVLDLMIDPPPDLCVEIEISRSVVDRLGIYAALRIPELWRCDGETLQAWRLREDGQYEPCPHSPSLPFLPLEEVLPALERSLDTGDDGETLRSLRAWVRERVRPLWEAARASNG